MRNDETCIDFHLRCIQCAYDLHQLSRASRCPECGTPILMTLIDVVGRATQTPYGLRAVGLESGLMSVAGHTRFTIDAVRLLWHALHFTHEALKPPNATPSLPGSFKAGVMEIMTGIREITLLHFGASAQARLQSMGLATGGDVAELMAEMVRQKIFALSEGDSLEDFAAYTFDLTPS